MDSTLETPRLRLIRLTDTSDNSQHLQWFHQLWNDDATTAWSLHGKCHTIQQSQQWMTKQMTEMDNILYAVFVKSDTSEADPSNPGELVGNVGLRLQKEGPYLPPSPPPQDSTFAVLKPETAAPGSTPGEAPAKSLNLRALGYAYFQSAWGKGYGTEAGRAVIDAYAASIAEKQKEGEETFYIEATWDKDNPASKKVLTKLGFFEVGWLVETEPIFLAGAWRDPGQWIWGLYL